jgi:hypothetical protein
MWQQQQGFPEQHVQQLVSHPQVLMLLLQWDVQVAAAALGIVRIHLPLRVAADLQMGLGHPVLLLLLAGEVE